MAFGVKSQNPEIDKVEKKRIAIAKKIKRIVAKHGFDDAEWAQAISSQYFLLCLAKQLNWAKKDYVNLLNKCLSSFSVTYTGDYVLDKEKILITPKETARIVACMQEEDDTDDYYTYSAKMQAKNIDTNQMYLNFHYGLLVRIVSSEDTGLLRNIKHTCLEHLTEDVALDTSDGWYPYRVPWITARILISLKNIDYSTYPEQNKIQNIIDGSISSLFQRINENAAYWRSGVGKWVSKWESTALCLEALYVWNVIEENSSEIKKVLDYVCAEENKNLWLGNNIGFSSEETANDTLSSIILASVVFRITRKFFSDIYESICEDILNYLVNVVTIIDKQTTIFVRQYCTIPQILYYVMAAFE